MFKLLSLTFILSIWSCFECTYAKNNNSVELDLDNLGKSLKSTSVEITDALTSSEKKLNFVKYDGYKLTEVLALVFKNDKKWKNSKVIVFECADGYKAEIQTDIIFKYDGYLVYKFSDNSKFEISNNTQGGKIVQLSPLYLVWNSKEMISPSKARFWPYQIVSISIKN